MWSHWQTETLFTQHAWCSWSLLSSPHSLLFLKCLTHMHASTVARISTLTVLSRPVLLLCRQTNRPSSSGELIHQAGAEQPSSAGCCSSSALLCTSSRSGCATSGSDPGPQPPYLHRQSPERLMSSQCKEHPHRSRKLLMEPLDTSRLDRPLLTQQIHFRYRSVFQVFFIELSDC